MKLYHITETKNLHSILEHGLNPSIPKLKHHRESNAKVGMPPKVIYAWKYRSDRHTMKISKDVAYWHVWGWRINDILTGIESEELHTPYESHDNAKVSPDLPELIHPAMEPSEFVTLMFNVSGDPKKIMTGLWYAYYHHNQEINNYDPCYSKMDPARQHNEPLAFVTDVVPPSRIKPYAFLWTEVRRANNRWHLKVFGKAFK